MNERQEQELRIQLDNDERGRNREQYDYTGDALRESGILPLSIWPESNQNVKNVISGKVDYNTLPIDEENEIYKGFCFTEQQDIILRNWGKYSLCEALDMNPCLEERCKLYNSELGPPVCREFKIAFKK